MSNKYQHIQQLILLWQDYEEETKCYDIDQFGEWLSHRKTNIEKTKAKEFDKNESKQQFVFLLSRLSRLNDFYSKKYFEGLPINTLLEFSFLFSINKNASSNKSDIIHLHMVEYSTGIDILNRLIRLELVSEYKDGYDKRKKRIKIATNGKRVLMEALIRIKHVQDLFFADITEIEMNMALPVLEKINKHHSKISLKQGETSLADIFNSLS